MNVVTHSGKFHADDVLAWALLRHYHPNRDRLKISRTRDPGLIREADIVFDVGGIYDPSLGRFDHHQNEYQGPLSSAGMVLEWLETSNHLPKNLVKILNNKLVSYVDDVDNGRVEENINIPCFSTIISIYNSNSSDFSTFDQQFHLAAEMAYQIIHGIEQQYNQENDAKDSVIKEMKRSSMDNSALLEFPKHLSWKSTYFDNNGEDHPSQFVMYRTMYGKFQVTAIPPEFGSFSQKKSFPIEWAGLRDEELSAVTGVPSIFCHKNRFIAVFESRQGAIEAMTKFGLI